MDKKIYITQPSIPDINEYIEEIKDIWENKWLTNMGPKHKKLQGLLEEFFDTENIELMVNGHMALELSLQALNLQGEVITTPFTFASTTHAIVRNNLEPVFCDINQTDYTIDVEKLESLINEKTCAIMPVHVYGNICNIEEIERIAHKYELKVVYDAAHAFGEVYKNKNIATFGDVSCFSFHATKVFNSIEGGAVCYKDKRLGQILYDLKNFGIHGPEEVSAVGSNAKMNEFSAAMGICNLKHIDEDINKRETLFNRYMENLGSTSGLRLNKPQDNVKSNYAYFPILIDSRVFGASRNEVFDTLYKNDIIVRKYFYPLTNSFSAFHNKYDVMKTPVAMKVSKQILTLPLYPNLEIADIDRICKVILECKY